MQQTPTAYLIIHLGNRWTDVLKLQPEQPVTVGRSSDCQIVVRDERVSRKHASISPQSGKWCVADLQSRNGTQVENSVIEGNHPLSDGETIEVGGCQITYVERLAGGFQQHFPPLEPSSNTSQATQEVPPTILNKRTGSQWTAELDPAQFRDVEQPQASTWNFFYRLISDLVGANSSESAAQIALDRLLSKLGVASGGVVTFADFTSEQEQTRDVTPALVVLAAKQSPGKSYHRASDFLVQTVAKEKQAVLARNVQNDGDLSVARESGQQDVESIICAPIRSNTSVSLMGLLHVYATANERVLTESDLELVVGVADNLAIALSQQTENQKLNDDLESSQRRVELLEEQLDHTTVMVGKSQALSKVKTSISRAGPTDATVLVRGESGVGKELVARAIHQNSPRKTGPLVCLNCAALAPTLLESELFGHEKGAFTGATDRKIGKFEAANKGTLLLDEIGEMSPELQAKFLRVLEGQPFERLGGNKPIQTDVRVIAATNRALEDAVQEKEFRADLYYRLRVIEIYIPPLRERVEDIPLLVEHFMAQLGSHAGRRLEGVAPKTLELLTRHQWPGNVRELRNTIERAIVLGGSSSIQPEDVSLSSLSNIETPKDTSQAVQAGFQPVSLAELEKKHIYSMLEFTENNKTKASQLLGIERSTLDRKLKRFKD